MPHWSIMGKGNRKWAHVSDPNYRNNYEKIFGKKGIPDREPDASAKPRKKVRLFVGPGEYTRTIFTGDKVYTPEFGRKVTGKH